MNSNLFPKDATPEDIRKIKEGMQQLEVLKLKSQSGALSEKELTDLHTTLDFKLLIEDAIWANHEMARRKFSFFLALETKLAGQTDLLEAIAKCAEALGLHNDPRFGAVMTTVSLKMIEQSYKNEAEMTTIRRAASARYDALLKEKQS